MPSTLSSSATSAPPTGRPLLSLAVTASRNSVAGRVAPGVRAASGRAVGVRARASSDVADDAACAGMHEAKSMAATRRALSLCMDRRGGPGVVENDFDLTPVHMADA